MTEDRFMPVPMLAGDAEQDIAQIRDQVRAWVTSDPIRALLEEFGSGLPSGNLEDLLQFTDDFSTHHWDYRNRTKLVDSDYIERSQVRWDGLSREREALILSAAHALGLVDARPPRWSHYDYVVVLGGMARANRRRSLYAAHLMQHVVSCDSVVGLSSFREPSHQLGDGESVRLTEYAMPIRKRETEMLQDALRIAFASDAFVKAVVGGGRGYLGEFAASSAGGVSLAVLGTPDTTAGRRPGTRETMRYWSQHAADLMPGQRILCVTTSIYAPYQHAIAIEVLGLPFEVYVDTVGVDGAFIEEVGDPPSFKASQYLQEIRSALQSYRSLIQYTNACAPATPGPLSDN